MGGKSSKHNISSASKVRGSSSTINTVDRIEFDTKDKKNKKKAKTKDRKEKKKNKRHALCNKHMKISFDENTNLGVGGDCDGGRKSSGPYRKKSACPSCDARDMLMQQIRSRSGSLRYSDFNTVMRQSRVYEEDERPTDIPLDGVPDPLPETVCFICGVYTGSVTRTCRVCCHVYHNGCLQKIRQAMDQRALQLAQMDMWSCHQCSDISRLLTREETHCVYNCLEELDVDADSITVNDYVNYKVKMFNKLGRNVTRDRKLAWIGRFNFVAGDRGEDGKATLDWSQFLQAETISILRNRCKDSLVKLMTEMEFAAARKLYKEMGKAGTGVMMAQVKDRILQLYMKFGFQIWPEDQEDVESLEEEDFERRVEWGEFLRILAIHMITIRENNPSRLTQTEKSGDSPVKNDKSNEELSPSFDSLDEVDHHTCDSDFDAALAITSTTSKNETVHKRNLSDMQALNESDDDANKSISLLDDLSRAFNLGGNSSVFDNNPQNQELDQNNSNKSETEIVVSPVEDSTSVSSSVVEEPQTSASAANNKHLWRNPSNIRDNPNFTTVMDVPLTKENVTRQTRSLILEKSPIVTKRRSEVLVRPSTEEGKSPRRVLSQKLVAPAYGLVDKMQSQDWQC